MSRFTTRAQTLQWIDRRLGATVCGLLTAMRRISTPFRRRRAAAAPRSVLFVKLAEQGSTVLAHEAIRLAAARVGRERVYFLVFEENRFILDLLGLVPPENVFTIHTRSAWSMATSCLARLRAIRRLQIDACIDLEFFARTSAAIAFLTGARQRVGFHSYFQEGPYRGDLFTHRVLYNAHLHTAQVFQTLVFALEADPAMLPTLPCAAPVAPPPSWFRPSPEEVAVVRRTLGHAGVPEGAPLVLLNANASDLLPLRRWAGANYVALAQRLLTARDDLWIAFTGAPDEEPAIAELVRAVGSPRCVCLAGRTTLRELIVLYGLAELLVTNDSGPAHFASLTPLDVIVLFGPETPLLFGGLGPRSHALWAGVACSPCVNAYNNRQTACRNNVCMQRIPVEQVCARAIEVLATRRGRPA